MSGGALHVQRPRLTWIKRRARRIMQAHGTPRRFAIWDAWADYAIWTHDVRAVPATPLRQVGGGAHHG